MRTFHLQRSEDATGVSGVGRVAEGIQFTNGRCCLSWCTEVSSIGVYQSIEDLIAIHGHSGQTKVVYDE